jgi:hypothetical protein
MHDGSRRTRRTDQGAQKLGADLYRPVPSPQITCPDSLSWPAYACVRASSRSRQSAWASSWVTATFRSSSSGTYKTAAAALGVTLNTIAFHMRRIYEKLQVHSKSEAVAKALRHRLIR